MPTATQKQKAAAVSLKDILAEKERLAEEQAKLEAQIFDARAQADLELNASVEWFNQTFGTAYRLVNAATDKPRQQRKCSLCGQPGHRARKCPNPGVLVPKTSEQEQG